MGKNIKLKQAKLCACVLGSALLLYIPNVHAAEAEEQEEYSFDQVVVTATKTPVKVFEANANMTVITRDEIEKNHYHDLVEVLRDVPGVAVYNYGGGVGYEETNGLRINGAKEIVVLVDGIKVNAATSGPFPFGAYSALENIERIEVLKGSASALYGSDAKGGVINIITRKAERNSTSLTLTGGSNGKESYSLLNQGKSGDLSWVITSQKDILGDYKDGHGVRIPQHRNGETNSFKLTQNINDDSDVTLMYENYKADYRYADSAFGTDNHRAGNADNSSWKMIYNNKVSEKGHNQVSFFNGDYDTTYGIGSTWGSTTTKVKTIGIQEQFTQKMDDRHIFTTGFDFNQDKVVNLNGVKLINRALYAQDEWNMNNQWKLTSGVRYDNHSDFGSHTTPHMNLGYKQNDNTNYYLSYSEFFIAPTPVQLYDASYGNRDLDPEDGRTIEAGINHKFNETLTGTFHIFQRKSNNVIGFVYTDLTTYEGHYINRNKEKVHGWDVQLNKKFSNVLSGFVGFTGISTETSDQQDNANGYIPKGTWNVGLNYRQDRYDAALLGRGIINRVGPTPSNGLPALPASTYWVWDASFNYKITKQARAFIKVNNILDKYYAEFSNVAYGYPDPIAGDWWSSPGRNYQIGIQYQF
ncbi:TonB-dependent receptor plug domain-containing protein [Pelosinus propionicus]|uniref:Vitamin B12 transporter n=1 Tax=Pelosinus propionicus DSM 13327 TaxID=1123291 RepID=A0A1I4N5N3_9FIRM|nr:TonB-dependent receptor [Pelosinus propionicus]SFM10573.1 vitamin B12 transporter [Pelosinus propionicus DSM 13327]